MLNIDSDYEFEHAPLAILDYGLDWSSWLVSGETITNSTWTVDTGLTKSLEQNLAGVTSLFVSGGVVGKVYKLTNTITTSTTRSDSRTIRLSCRLR